MAPRLSVAGWSAVDRQADRWAREARAAQDELTRVRADLAKALAQLASTDGEECGACAATEGGECLYHKGVRTGWDAAVAAAALGEDEDEDQALLELAAMVHHEGNEFTLLTWWLTPAQLTEVNEWLDAIEQSYDYGVRIDYPAPEDDDSSYQALLSLAQWDEFMPWLVGEFGQPASTHDSRKKDEG
jgi:hypothetical protein